MAFRERVTRADLERWAPGGSFGEAQRYAEGGRLADLAATPAALRGAVAGSGAKPYQVVLGWQQGRLVPHCTCPAFRRTPWCKHALAVALAWMSNPASFVEAQDVAEEARVRLGKREKRQVADPADLVAAGLTTVEQLLAELGMGGTTALARDRIAALDDLAAQVGAQKLRRLQGNIRQLRIQLEAALANGGRFRPAAYLDVLADLHYTVLALRRHRAGQTLPDAQVEDLLGKVWLTKNLPAATFAALWEVAFEASAPVDDLIVEVSYLLDLATGTLYQERQSRSTRARGEAAGTPKEPYGDQPLVAVEARLYPAGEPRRLKITASQRGSVLDHAALAPIAARAETTVAGLAARLATVAADPSRARVPYTFFHPPRLISDTRALWAVDDAGRAVPLAPREWAARPGLHFNGQTTDLKPLLHVRDPLLIGFLTADQPLAERGIRYHPLAAIDLAPAPGGDVLVHCDDRARWVHRRP